MRGNIVAGLCLAFAAGIIVVLSSAFDLDLESAALLGGALGAVVALVPDRSAAARLAGFGAGLVVSWLGYACRASLMPDSSAGRAVAVVAVVLVCVALVAGSRNWLPLWAVLLGTAAFAGAYEFTYDQAPPELVDTSITAATTLLFNVAAGFLAASLFTPAPGSPIDGAQAGSTGAPDPGAGVETAADPVTGPVPAELAGGAR